MIVYAGPQGAGKIQLQNLHKVRRDNTDDWGRLQEIGLLYATGVAGDSPLLDDSRLPVYVWVMVAYQGNPRINGRPVPKILVKTLTSSTILPHL